MLIEKNAGKTSEVNQVAEAPTPVVPAAPAQEIVNQAAELSGVSGSKLEQMLALLIEEKVRTSALAREEAARVEAKRTQYRRNASDGERATLKFQSKCRHLKGGKNRKARNTPDDFNVYAHVFITGESYIRCNGCDMKWRPTDTKEFVARNGNVYKNHTKLGWAEAMEMVFKSSNQRSSSEIPPQMFGNIVKDFAPKTQEDEIGVDLEPVGTTTSGTI
jgi:hypothetical protein